jgi:hypothetical protein
MKMGTSNGNTASFHRSYGLVAGSSPAGPTNEINHLSSLLLHREGPPHQLSGEVLLTAINWPGTQYVMDEMTKGLFGAGRKIGNHSAQKGQLDRSPINCPFEANFKMVQRSLALDRHSV